MGVVWRVFHREWGRDLALKMPLPELLQYPAMYERFFREAETWIGLGVHPHIVQCWFVANLHGLPALFLDFLTGGSLKGWIEDGHVKPGRWDLILEIAMQVAEGLAYAHSKGVVHRDIKPENLLFRGDERVCVTDFGLVKTAVSATMKEGGLADDDSASGGVTGAGGVLGTPRYGAPEQWGSAERVGPSADLYALGVILYEMCCGRRPFDAPDEEITVGGLIQRHLQDIPPDPRVYHPDIPEELALLCLLMLEKEPRNRPPQMLALREILSAIYHKVTHRQFRPPTPLLGAQSPDVLNNQAVSLFSLGKSGEALETLRRGLRLDPGHPECLFNLVQLEKRQGRIAYTEALRRLRQARAELPLALLMLEEDLAGEAVQVLQSASAEATAFSGPIQRALGDALMYTGQFGAAAQAYRQALALMPKDQAASLGIRLASEGRRETDEGIYFPPPTLA